MLVFTPHDMNTLQNAKNKTDENKGKIVRIEFSYYGWKHM